MHEIEKAVEENPFITNDALGKSVDLSTTTARKGVEIVGLKSYHALKITKLD